ncbi:hypothetical protein MGYG_08340 [Nannizzia gypsea CBS 118893]|uniref:Uncharacterized protein n=1 Tax=Arthroderma gypseum (strain ATCC MYA-4604 / CBS 118893) TaxID=535722 RepID=E4V5F4_ARTGP|nr:hypothetical protein MGYG_08340 [Nannizzia gypsea CBS 118893]EFR05329.1 hypothetical protein MGYG_08340 [Nannizzia gypsea CBS 118893]
MIPSPIIYLTSIILMLNDPLHIYTMKRSNTTSMTSFTLPDLHKQAAAIFDFTSDGDSIRVTVPINSTWNYWEHWLNPHSFICDEVTSVSGRGFVEIYYFDDPSSSRGLHLRSGESMSFGPRSSSTWRRAYSTRDQEDFVANLKGDRSFHRNVCSAIIDRDRMAFLSSTPILLRQMLAFLGLFQFSRPFRECILDLMLAIQLRAIFYANGFWIHHPTIPFFWWWEWRQIWGEPRVPEWAYEFRWKMLKVITYTVQGICYWVGRLFLGMKGSYPEYTP